MTAGQKYTVAVTVILAALAFGTAGFFIGRQYGQNHAKIETETKTDTLYLSRVDTLVMPAKIKWRTVTDTMTVTVHDTVTVQLPRERIEYGDTSYFAVVSGYRPSLDSLVVFPKIVDKVITTEVTRTIPPKRWGFGVQVGAAAGYFITPKGWQVGAGPAVSVGLHYRF